VIDTERLDRLRLARTDGVGPVTYRRLLAEYGTADAAIAALPGIALRGGRAAPVSVPDRDATARERDAVTRMGGTMLLLGDADYPHALALFDPAPPVLSVLGDVSALGARAVALVGARNASANGQRMAEALATELAMGGLIVVSGLARGIDAAAHEGALRGGRTVAAIAGGLDCPYPPENTALQRRVAEGGAVVSIAPLGTAPRDRHFPRRNRVIAGLSLGVVVVEAAPRSGSLITATMAQEAGREVFAVPGSPLDPRCRGSNDLLRQGATLVENAADVLANLPESIGEARPASRLAEPASAAPEPPWDATRARETVLRLLGPGPTAVDELVRRSHLTPSAVAAVLTGLELDGRVEWLPGHRISLLMPQ
jgi:DNA processing protein